MVETSDQWITERTGIKNRFLVGPGETCSDLGARAALDACQKAGVDPADIELIVFATITPDMMLP
ncbi:MAG TPA: 3-oxoacyl-ACP synthase, partial [Candidatus Obscuribacter sp.]|nr:3-oxoacyl-ACP synthase [Candidatus Obscuribacter sp.]